MIKPFKDKDFLQLIVDMNKFELTHKVFATNIFPPTPWSEYWYGLSFYNQSVKSEAEIPKGEKPVTKDSNSSNNSPRKSSPSQLAYVQSLADELGCDIKTSEDYNEMDKLIKDLLLVKKQRSKNAKSN